MQKIKQLAFRKLSQRRYFAEELKQLLLREGFDLTQVSQLIEEMSNQGYLDDQEGIESVIRKAIQQTKGPIWIQLQLKMKGVKTDFNSIERHYPLSLREEKIALFFEKHKKSGKKAINALARRGFAWEEIIRVYKHFF
jgi:SOS response regulatory protein OraA/RecX